MQGNRLKLHDRQLESVNIKAAYNKHECNKKDIVRTTDLLTHRSNNESTDPSQIVFVTKIKVVNLNLPNEISTNNENFNHTSWKRQNTLPPRFWRKHSKKNQKPKEKSSSSSEENHKNRITIEENNNEIENNDLLEKKRSQSPDDTDSCDSTIIANILVESLNLKKDNLAENNNGDHQHDTEDDVLKILYNRKQYDKKIKTTDKDDYNIPETTTLSSDEQQQSNDSAASQKNHILISLPNRFQRTPSPETTQIIRVDVRTSNIPPPSASPSELAKNSTSPRPDKSIKHRQKQSASCRQRNFVNSKPCKLNVTCLKLELNLRNNAVT